MTHSTLIETPSGRVRVFQSGPADGPVLVFTHGALVDASLWQPLIERLADRYRCIAPELPLGSHREPLRPDADTSPPGVADLVVSLLDALDIGRATLVGNDSGGAIAQLVAARHPTRVARLILTNCDAFEVMPPTGYGYIRLLRFAWLGRLSGWMFSRFPRLGLLPYTWAPLARELSTAQVRGWARPIAEVPGVARDFAKFAAEAHPRHTLAAAEALATFPRPVRLVWGAADRFFEPQLAERLARHVPDGELVLVPGARTYVMLDEPDAVARAITRWVPLAARAAA